MKRLLTSVVLATALISTETSAKTDWWGVASDVLELTSTVMNNKAPVASGGTRSHRAKSYVTSYEYEQAPALYSDWIKVDRKRHSFSPEFLALVSVEETPSILEQVLIAERLLEE